MIKLIKTFFNKKIKLIKVNQFVDKRGYFAEIYNKKNYQLLNIKENFIQDNQSLSKAKGTIRGLHFQIPPMCQSKLISVYKGSIQDIILDLRLNSKTYGKDISVILNESDFYQLYIFSGPLSQLHILGYIYSQIKY